jgi:anti-sigma factor RsiW
MDTVMDRETLEAFVDGALTPEESARVVLHLADCPEDAAYVDALMEANALVAAAYAEPLHQPVPERLRATIFPAGPAAAPASAPPRAAGDPRGGGWRALRLPPRRAAWGALAASFALVLGVAAVSQRETGRVQLAGGPAADAALAAALETRPSGAVPGGPASARITLIATFLAADSRPCREYEILDAAAGALAQGIACRTPGEGWATEIAVASRLDPAADRGGAFVPAEGAGAGGGALDGALDRLGAGMLLSPDEERALIESGWSG